ncbi:MAG TPA: thioredoxin fold domain-containing protein [Pyrinomonadaceae bacterium]|nr:thioredoxin fold domain-containing protein [Pyrinomonadaceae bacterium]
MKFSISLFLILLTVFPLAGRETDPDRWLRDAPGYEQALELQKESNGPLIVYFYTDWCPYCRSLDNQYLPSQPVRDYLRTVVKVRINPEHGRAERELANRYGVTGYPSYFVIQKSSAAPRQISPFRRSGPNLTTAEFAVAMQNVASTTARRLVAPPVVRDANAQAVANASKQASASKMLIAPAVESTLPSIDYLLDRYVNVRGGRDAQTKLNSRVAKGRVDVVGVSFGGTLKTYAKAPNKSLTIMQAEPIGLFKRGYDGQSGWSLSAKSGSELINGFELASLANDSDFYRDLKLRQLYQSLKVVGRVREGFRELYKVEATPRAGLPEYIYFDEETGLLTRRETQRKTSAGMSQIEFYYSDWRDVDGVKIPFKTTQKIGQTTYLFSLEEVRHNVPVEDSLFTRP